jgi:hypothetical protein
MKKSPKKEYGLRLFHRPEYTGSGWRLFPAWKLHEGMDKANLIAWWLHSDNKDGWGRTRKDYLGYIEKQVELGKGTPEEPLSGGGGLQCCVIDIKDFPKYSERIEFSFCKMDNL